MKPYIVSLIQDPLIKQVIEYQCNKENRWKFLSAESFSQFNKYLINYDVIVVIIDKAIEDKNALDLTLYIKQVNNAIGIIVINNNVNLEFCRSAYQMGVDYIFSIPFDPITFRLQTINLFKRAEQSFFLVQKIANPSQFSSLYKERFIYENQLLVDLDSGVIAYKGETKAQLGSKESKIVSLLYQNLHEVVTHETIKSVIFQDITTSRARVCTIVRRVKDKLKGKYGLVIENIHGKGYRMRIKGILLSNK